MAGGSPFALPLVLVLVATALVLAGAVLLTRPQRGVLLLAALVPFNGLLLLVPHPGIVDGWKEGLLLVTAGAALLNPAPDRRRGVPPWAPALGALVLVSLGSAAAVGGSQAVLGLKIDYFYVLLVPVLLRTPLTPRDRDRLVGLLMVTGVVTSVVGLAQQVVGQEALAALGYEYDVTIRTSGGLLRSFSTFNQPFPFGLYEMLVLLVAVPVALTDVRRRRNALFLWATPVLVIGMLTSIVRAAIAGLVVGGAFLWWHRYRVLAHVVPGVLAAALFVPAAVYGPLLSSSSLGERSTGWSATFGKVLAAPWGNGIGATGSAAEKAAEVAGTAASTYQPDNYYFKTAFELGPLGLWLFVLVLVSAFSTARRTSSALRSSALRATGSEAVQLRSDAALAAGTAASVLAAAVASTVATYFEIFPLDVFFWLLLGVLTSLVPTEAASPSTPSPCAPAAAVSRPTSGSSSGR